jgi:hypothetical protein
MVFITKVSNKNSIHIFKYKRCKTYPIEINVKNMLIKYLGFAMLRITNDDMECGVYRHEK